MKNILISFLIGAAIAIPICGCAGTQWYRLPDPPTMEQALYDREDAPLEIWEKGSMAVCEAAFGKVKKAPAPTAIGTEASNRQTINTVSIAQRKKDCMSEMSDERIKEFAGAVKPLAEKALALLEECPEFDHINIYVSREKNWIDITAGDPDEDGVGNVSIYSYDGQPEDCVGNIHRYDSEWKNGVVVR